MTTQVIVLNGGSSSGKSGIARCLQAELPTPWLAAATARAGAHVIIDDVFLGGPASREPWRKALTGLDVPWVGVRCESGVAEAREIARGDRPKGMAAAQAEKVHEGVSYDVEVDTTHMDSRACARTIAAHVT
ncbi:phosphotransferase-like protein [Streptomyces parvus]|uniref:phosphotransferase-like protein n=1 Tax=Streptomyces parvus TaxID=66428 RepID=UPI0036B6D9F3